MKTAKQVRAEFVEKQVAKFTPVQRKVYDSIADVINKWPDEGVTWGDINVSGNGIDKAFLAVLAEVLRALGYVVETNVHHVDGTFNIRVSIHDVLTYLNLCQSGYIPSFPK